MEVHIDLAPYAGLTGRKGGKRNHTPELGGRKKGGATIDDERKSSPKRENIRKGHRWSDQGGEGYRLKVRTHGANLLNIRTYTSYTKLMAVSMKMRERWEGRNLRGKPTVLGGVCLLARRKPIAPCLREGLERAWGKKKDDRTGAKR